MTEYERWFAAELVYLIATTLPPESQGKVAAAIAMTVAGNQESLRAIWESTQPCGTCS